MISLYTNSDNIQRMCLLVLVNEGIYYSASAFTLTLLETRLMKKEQLMYSMTSEESSRYQARLRLLEVVALVTTTVELLTTTVVLVLVVEFSEVEMTLDSLVEVLFSISELWYKMLYAVITVLESVGHLNKFRSVSNLLKTDAN